MNVLEGHLRWLGHELRAYQLATFFKIPEEMQQTPCDFIGYTATGRAILIEAKMVKRTALPIGKSPGLLPHQWNELCDAERAGALALICWARDGVLALMTPVEAASLLIDRRSIPWEGIPREWKRPFHRSFALTWLDRWLSVPAHTGGHREDLLDIITN